jgi:hypothetical protein
MLRANSRCASRIVASWQWETKGSQPDSFTFHPAVSTENTGYQNFVASRQTNIRGNINSLTQFAA